MAKRILTKLQLFVKTFPDNPFYVGVDVHKRSYHVAVRRADGQTYTFVTGASPEGLLKKLQELDVGMRQLPMKPARPVLVWRGLFNSPGLRFW